MSGENRRVALVTGATGFIGGEITKSLLLKGWHVIIVIRPKSKRSRSKRVRKRTLSCAERMEGFVFALGLTAEESSRLHHVELDLVQMKDPKVFFLAVKSILVDKIGSRRLDVVIHSAASLAQESPAMPAEKQARIRQRNLSTNVEGLDTLLQCIENFGCPENIRIIRPSIVCGVGSRTGLMAFLNYYGRRTLGIQNYKIMGPILRCQKIIPFYGNPDAIVDIIDVNDAVGAMLGFVDLDCSVLLHEEPVSLTNEHFSVGAVHYLSTAYVHGKRTGVLMEEDVYAKPGQEYNNSYEESKGIGEAKLKSWFRKCLEKSQKYRNQEALERKLEDSFGYYNLTNEFAPTLRELVESVNKTLGWPKVTEKMVFCRTQEEFEGALSRIRFKYIAHLTRLYWKRVEVLFPYLLRGTGTTFDCSQTKAALPNFTTEGLRKYFPLYLARYMGLKDVLKKATRN